MTLALWLALYLWPRGPSGPSTQRAVIVLLAFSASAFLSFVNLFQPVAGLGAWWALLLTLSLIVWYDLVYRILPADRAASLRWIYWACMGMGSAKILLLAVLHDQAPGETGSALWISAGRAEPLAVLDAAFLVGLVLSLLANFRTAIRSGLWLQSRSMWAASLLAAAGSGYGAIALLSPVPIWRLPMDLLLTASVIALGYSIAQHQALVLRHTLLQELPVTGLTIFAVTGVYLLFASQRQFSPVEMGVLAMLAVLTHSFYDVVKEIVDRWLYRRESRFRQQLRGLARTIGDDHSLRTSLHIGLHKLCEVLGASGGVVAVRGEAGFQVVAAVNVVAAASLLTDEQVVTRELRQPAGELARTLAWIAPVLVGQEQVAVVGLGRRQNGLEYEDADLDWLDEMADWVGRLLAAQRQQALSRAHVEQIAEEANQRLSQLREASSELLETLGQPPAPDFVRQVEDGLRHLTDYGALGQSTLAEALCVAGGNHLDRGKEVRQALIHAIESLRPAGPRPTGILPREWHAYAILNDAYVQDVPNREIMARLYISEGTFNRQRRKALSAAARAVAEAHPNWRPA